MRPELVISNKLSGDVWDHTKNCNVLKQRKITHVQRGWGP